MATKGLLIVLCTLFVLSPVFAREITLVKHASRSDQLVPAHYIVQPNDTLWKIFMHDFKAKGDELPGLYEQFRQLNPGVKNLNHILAGQKLIIPQTIETFKPPEQQGPEHDIYEIQKGEYLTQILREVYGLSDERIFKEYLQRIKELNPEIEDLNLLQPGQKIKIPNPKIAETLHKEKLVEERQIKALAPVPKESLVLQEIEPLAPEITSHSIAPAEIEHEKAQNVSNPDSPMITTKGDPFSGIAINTMFPALEKMGILQKDKGTYFLPVSGANIAIDTKEIPVIELDSGRRIILDIHNKISPEVKNLIESAFPSCKVVSGAGSDLEDFMDRILSAGGYFSVNKNAAPVLVGEEEKVRFFGKWIIYKDATRHEVLVINLLSDDENQTPTSIQSYAARFGIELIEIGGLKDNVQKPQRDYIRDLNHSYLDLFNELGITYEQETEIELVALDAVHIVYVAPIILQQDILTQKVPDGTMQELLEKKGYRLTDTSQADMADVLKRLGTSLEGPPLKIIIAPKRIDVDLPAIRLGKKIILRRIIDRDITEYLASMGMDILIW